MSPKMDQYGNYIDHADTTDGSQNWLDNLLFLLQQEQHKRVNKGVDPNSFARPPSVDDLVSDFLASNSLYSEPETDLQNTIPDLSSPFYRRKRSDDYMPIDFSSNVKDFDTDFGDYNLDESIPFDTLNYFRKKKSFVGEEMIDDIDSQEDQAQKWSKIKSVLEQMAKNMRKPKRSGAELSAVFGKRSDPLSELFSKRNSMDNLAEIFNKRRVLGILNKPRGRKKYGYKKRASSKNYYNMRQHGSPFRTGTVGLGYMI